ncbi:hypothetical protein O6H91_06G084900 [Diphasiastrum complanatum]|uniref:Uncharacterized protein n=2 Tax=Diphasiastrum complanatum TaxID=34168 RepID=A0ACC2DFZ4_DIPCM|nr:hypothetical protein O6H91_06G084900 [Diphasiastrum complanatum]KAJ7553119.1 hypothetical protein O6H91_06G084900 [Diphasiastrum complanatum]
MSELRFGKSKSMQFPRVGHVKSGLSSHVPETAEFHTREVVEKLLQKDGISLSSSNQALSKSSSNLALSHKLLGDNKHMLSESQCSEGHKTAADATNHNSLTKEVVHVAAETYLLTRLTIILLGYLGLGYRWITKCIALLFYAAFLMPGFIQIGWYYFFSKSVHRSLIYGDQPRNRLDLYLPQKLNKPKPAVAFVTGGAWIIGYKAWGALLAQELAEEDVIVACIDYRNFPQGTVTDMVADVASGLSFFCKNIVEYGADPSRLYLAGQSAGAHLAACALVEQVRKEMFGGKDNIAWCASQFRAYFGISGGYNLPDLVNHFHTQGLYRSIFLSVTFADALQSIHAKATLKLYPGKTHTDLFLQDPMRGGKDELLRDILAVINEGDEEAEAKYATAPPRRRLVPEFLLQLARKVSPF